MRTHKELFDSFDTQFLSLQSDLVCSRSEFSSERSDRTGERSGKQNDLRLLPHLRNQTVEEISISVRRNKAESALFDLNTLISHRSLIQHIIRLVEHKDDDVGKIQNAMPNHHLLRNASQRLLVRRAEMTDLNDGTRRSDDDLLRQGGHSLGHRIPSGVETFDGSVNSHLLHDREDL